jgi:hypothetical protein
MKGADPHGAALLSAAAAQQASANTSTMCARIVGKK